MGKVKIAIPTYKRYECETLKILDSNLFEPTLFVNDDIEKMEYEKVNKGISVVATNTKGITNARNAILSHYKPQDEVVMADDDIRSIQYVDPQGKKLIDATSAQISELCQKGFAECKKLGTKLWGVYPVHNAFYMAKKSTYYHFIIGSFSGVIISDLRYDDKMRVKEDYDFTMSNIFRFGKVVRFDDWTVNAKHYTNKGGCVDDRSGKKDIDIEAMNYLIGKYGLLIKKNPRREGEVIINSRLIEKTLKR